jgi:hypothetical protein
MIYYFHNEYHLGDNIFNLIFFNNIKDFLMRNCIHVYYYCQPQYIAQVQEFVTCPNVFIFSIDQKPGHSFQIWIENQKIGESFTQVRERNNGKVCYDIFYMYLFNNVMRKHNMPLKFNSFYYSDPDLLTRYDQISSKYKDIDILILNSQPFSDQFVYKKDDWDNHIRLLNKHYRVVTTTKVDDTISCTMDDNLTIKSIAALSIKVPVIIAVNSGVVPGLLNDLTLKFVKHFVIFDDRCYYSYPKFTNKLNIEDVSLESLKPYLPNFRPPQPSSPIENKNEEKRQQQPKVSEEDLKKKYKNFDWRMYLYFNPDLVNIDGQPTNEFIAWRHFVNHGIHEKRIFAFDWVKYIADNSLQDVAHNREEAFEHMNRNNNRDLYIKQSSFIEEENYKLQLFDWQYYVSIHPDLHNINNYEEALNHYIQHGQKEGRPMCDFNWMDYLILNKDLIEGGIVNEMQAIRHWTKHGKQEGRKHRIIRKK